MKHVIAAIAISTALIAPYTVAKDYTLAELGLNGMSVPKTTGDHLALGLKHMPIARDVWEDAVAGWGFDETPFGDTATSGPIKTSKYIDLGLNHQPVLSK